MELKTKGKMGKSSGDTETANIIKRTDYHCIVKQIYKFSPNNQKIL